MKLKKSAFSALTAVALSAVFAFASCGTTTTESSKGSDSVSGANSGSSVQTPTEAKITDGVFEEKISGDQPLYSFVHFYENGIFYKELFADPNGTFRGQNMGIGEWTLTEDKTAYIDASGASKTSERSVRITNYNWAGDAAYETQTLAYADGVIYGLYVRTANSTGAAITATLTHNPDSKLTSADEQPYEVAYYEGETEMYYVSLRHNGTYQDTATGNFYEGTWTMTETGYALAYSDGTTARTATLTPSADGMTAEYKNGDTTLTLNKPVEIVQVARFYYDITEPYAMTIELLAYSDGSALLKNSFQDMAKGSWQVNDDGDYSFNLGETYGTVTSAVGTNGKTTVTINGGDAGTFVLAKDGEEEAEPIARFYQDITQPYSMTIELLVYDDGSAVLRNTLQPDENMAEGSWRMSGGNYSFDLGETYGTMTSAVGEDGKTTVTLNAGDAGTFVLEMEESEEVEKVVLLTLTGTQNVTPPAAGTNSWPATFSLILYTDGSAVIHFHVQVGNNESADVDIDKGTYTTNDYEIPVSVTLVSGQTLTLSPNDTYTALSCEYTGENVVIMKDYWSIPSVSCTLTGELPRP